MSTADFLLELAPEDSIALAEAGREYTFEELRTSVAVLTGRIRWEDLLLSLRISAWRDPDRYNDYLVGLLKHADAAALDAVERYETSRDPDETVTVRSGGRAWEVSRYCPHAGEDLTHGAVISGSVLRCPCTTMPSESPTNATSTSAASNCAAKLAS